MAGACAGPIHSRAGSAGWPLPCHARLRRWSGRVLRQSDEFTGGLIYMADQARDGRGGDVKSTYRGTITITR